MKKYPKYLEKGDKFGRLTVIGVDESSKRSQEGEQIRPSHWKYYCKCICKNKVSVMKQSLVDGSTKSCGCLQKERIKECNCKINPIEDCGDYIKIFFFNKDHGYCVIDKEDYWKVKDYCWYRQSSRADGLFYASANSKGKLKVSIVLMHSIIFPTKEGFIPEHKDGDGLNNRKHNLRPATTSQNSMNMKISSRNTSGYKGVNWNKQTNKWRVDISRDKERFYLGYFQNKEDAIKARKEAEESYHNEWSFDNSRGMKNVT